MLVAPSVVEYVPTGQDLHWDWEVRPVEVEYVPAGHFLQELEPIPSEYVPIPQVLQTLGLIAPGNGEDVPTGQPVHWEIDVAAVTLEYVPGGQDRQVDDVLAA